MTHQAKVVLDSINKQGSRLTTLELTYPRIIHAEFMTHRMLSRNAASSRAIPIEKMIRMVQEHPYVPEEWGVNQKGMQAGANLEEREASKCRDIWLMGRDDAVKRAEALNDQGVHKQTVNRLLEPFMWMTVIASATEWDNFIHLRAHPDAHPEIQKVGIGVRDALAASTPVERTMHTPYIQDGELDEWNTDYATDLALKARAMKVSVGRCARVSYLTHDGVRDWRKDVELHDRLLASGHMSPFEHVAESPQDKSFPPRISNFHWSWCQYRKQIPGEQDILGSRG